MASPDSCKRLVASIVEFLEDELKREGVTPDMAESIDVARQCLHMAYTTTPEDVPAGQKKLIDMFTTACTPPVPVKTLTDQEKAEAEQFKQKGNELMKEQKFEDAIVCYTKAIEIDNRNAVYYCNRAAAQTGHEKFDMSLTDCKKALEIDPVYSKAYSRMGLTYSKMEIYDEAIKCYQKALELDPDNEGYKKNLLIAEEKQRSQNPMAGAAMPEGLGGFSNFMNNPMFMNMARQVMENPAMQQMAMNLMGNLGGTGQGAEAGEASGAGAPSMTNILEMGQQFAQQLSQNNPELVDQLRRQVQDPNASDKDESSS